MTVLYITRTMTSGSETPVLWYEQPRPAYVVRHEPLTDAERDEQRGRNLDDACQAASVEHEP